MQNSAIQKSGTTATLRRKFAAVTEDYENNGYNDNFVVQEQMLLYSGIYIQLTTL
jgi:hypothetical protein